jgi:hypothetical protein
MFGRKTSTKPPEIDAAVASQAISFLSEGQTYAEIKDKLTLDLGRKLTKDEKSFIQQKEKEITKDRGPPKRSGSSRTLSLSTKSSSKNILEQADAPTGFQDSETTSPTTDVSNKQSGSHQKQLTLQSLRLAP